MKSVDVQVSQSARTHPSLLRNDSMQKGDSRSASEAFRCAAQPSVGRDELPESAPPGPVSTCLFQGPSVT